MPNNTIELIVKATDQASAGIKNIAAQLNVLGKTADTVTEIFGAIFAGFTVEKLVESITEAETATNDLNRAFNAFGNTAGVTREDLDNFAETVSKTTTFTASSLKEAEAQLLQYTSITGQSFDEARGIIVDLAAKMGTDAANAAELLGRALQNPISGMRLLAQAGIVLTPQQRETIRLLVEEGDSANVLAFELGQLSLHTRGAASDLENTLGGALKNLQNSFAQAFEGQGANVSGLVEAIHALSLEVQDPKFQQSLQTIVSGIVTFGEAAAKATLAAADLAKGFGEGLAHAVNGADTPIGQVEDKIKALNELIAQPFLGENERDDYIVQLQFAKITLDKLTASAQSAAAAARSVLDDSYLGKPIDTSYAHKIAQLGTPVTEASSGRQAIDINQRINSNGAFAASLVGQFQSDTESDLDKAFDDLQKRVNERWELLRAGKTNVFAVLAGNDDDEHAYEAQVDKAFDYIQVTAKKLVVPLDEAQKTGLAVAHSLQGAFEQFFESGNLSAHNFLKTMLQMFDQILAKALSIDLVNALGLNKLFSDSSSSSQTGIIFGAIAKGIFGAAGGGDIHGPTWVGESGPELFVPGTSGTVMNSRQMAFAAGGGGGGLNYAPVYNIEVTSDDTSKSIPALVQFLTNQQVQSQNDLKRQMARNGIKLK